MDRNEPKILDFASEAAYRDYEEMPDEIQDEFGFVLWFVQTGTEDDPQCPKIIEPFGKGIQELKHTINKQNLTYRCMYYAKFDEVVYVLRTFNKKSHSGIATDLHDQNIINKRLNLAKEKYSERQK